VFSAVLSRQHISSPLPFTHTLIVRTDIVVGYLDQNLRIERRTYRLFRNGAYFSSRIVIAYAARRTRLILQSLRTSHFEFRPRTPNGKIAYYLRILKSPVTNNAFNRSRLRVFYSRDFRYHSFEPLAISIPRNRRRNFIYDANKLRTPALVSRTFRFQFSETPPFSFIHGRFTFT